MVVGWLTELEIRQNRSRCAQGPLDWELWGLLPRLIWLLSLGSPNSLPRQAGSLHTLGDAHGMSLYNQRETTSGLRNPI